jgi:transcriptional regulator with XRE-family HTH domain
METAESPAKKYGQAIAVTMVMSQIKQEALENEAKLPRGFLDDLISGREKTLPAPTIHADICKALKELGVMNGNLEKLDNTWEETVSSQVNGGGKEMEKTAGESARKIAARELLEYCSGIEMFGREKVALIDSGAIIPIGRDLREIVSLLGEPERTELSRTILSAVHEILEDYPAYFRRLRTEKGVSQTQLGKSVGMNNGAPISDIERNRNFFCKLGDVVPVFADELGLDGGATREEFIFMAKLRTLITPRIEKTGDEAIWNTLVSQDVMFGASDEKNILAQETEEAGIGPPIATATVEALAGSIPIGTAEIAVSDEREFVIPPAPADADVLAATVSDETNKTKTLEDESSIFGSSESVIPVEERHLNIGRLNFFLGKAGSFTLIEGPSQVSHADAVLVCGMIGLILRQRRLSLGKTLEQAASNAGMGLDRYKEIEKGAMANLNELKALYSATALTMSQDWDYVIQTYSLLERSIEIRISTDNSGILADIFAYI